GHRRSRPVAYALWAAAALSGITSFPSAGPSPIEVARAVAPVSGLIRRPHVGLQRGALDQPEVPALDRAQPPALGHAAQVLARVARQGRRLLDGEEVLERLSTVVLCVRHEHRFPFPSL